MRRHINGMRTGSLIFFCFVVFGISSQILQAKEEISEMGNLKNRLIYSHFLNALVLEQSGKFDQALKEYNRTLDLEPEATTVYRQRANLYLKMGNPNYALADAETYAKSHPENIHSQISLANIYMVTGQNSKARQVLVQILEKEPEHEEALLTLATMLMPEEPEESAKLFEKYVKLEPNSIEGYYNLGILYQKMRKSEESKKMFDKVVKIDEQSLQALVLLGQASESKEDITSAIEYFSKALEKMPQNFALRMQIVLLCTQKKDLGKIESLMEYYKDDPSVPVEASLWLGTIYENKKEWEKALQHYLRVQKELGSPEIQIRLAHIYSQLGKGKKALKSLKTLLIQDPQNSQYHYLLGLGYIDLKKPKKAIQSFEKAITLKKDFSSAYFQLGVIYDGLKNWKKAEIYFKEAIRADPENAPSYNYLGYTYADKNENLFQARKYIEKALEIDQQNPAYMDSLGWLNFREGNLKEALRHLQFASNLLPDPVIFDHLGECYTALEKIPDAVLNYSKSLELDPENKKVKEKLKKLDAYLVPESPAQKSLKKFEDNIEKISDLSGIFSLSGRINGFFYFRNRINDSKREISTELKVEFPSQFPLPPVIIRYRNNARHELQIFPPEAKDQLPAETAILIETITSFLNGKYVRNLNHWESRVKECRNSWMIKNNEIEINLQKKEALIGRITTKNQNCIVKKYQKKNEIFIPERMKIVLPAEKNGRTKRWNIEIRFSQISLEKVPEKIFSNW